MLIVCIQMSGALSLAEHFYHANQFICSDARQLNADQYKLRLLQTNKTTIHMDPDRFETLSLAIMQRVRVSSLRTTDMEKFLLLFDQNHAGITSHSRTEPQPLVSQRILSFRIRFPINQTKTKRYERMPSENKPVDFHLGKLWQHVDGIVDATIANYF